MIHIQYYDYCGYRCCINVEGRQETLDILDTAGQEQFAALQHHWIRESHAFLLVYSVSSDRTFKHTNDLYKTILRNKEGERVDIVLVGNKTDLPDNQHEVSYAMGKQLADNWECPFIETSAKTALNVQEAFELIVKEMKKEKGIEMEPIDASPGGCCTIL